MYLLAFGTSEPVFVPGSNPQAVITLDYCLVLTPEGGSEPVAAFVAELKGKVR